MWRLTACILLLVCSAFIFCAEEIAEEKPKPSGPPCAKNLTTPTGRIHLNVNNFTGVCVWSIAPSLVNATVPTISLILHSLFLHENDAVTLYKSEADVANDSLSLIEPLRAQNGSVTIVTAEKELYFKFTGDPNVTYIRNFDGMYQGHVCAFPLTSTPELGVQLIHSPIAANNMNDPIECKYVFNKDQHSRITASFLFREFKMGSSEVSLAQTTIDGVYKRGVPIDFFPINEHQPMTIDVKMPAKTNDSFCLQMRPVDVLCQGHKHFDASGDTVTLTSPKDTLNNGTILPECRWVIEHPDSKQVLGIQFVKLHFDSAIDIIAINDGPSELSTPLVQVTASSGNLTKYQLVRSTGPFMWVAFKPNTYASELSAVVQAHDQGGHFNGSGSIEMKPDHADAVFLLDVPENEIVLLEFDEKSSDFPSPATLSVYDGFDKTNLLATLHGKVWYPVISKSSKMMLIASQFKTGSFKATFKGMPANCLHMGSFSDENYVLSGNCNTTCLWVVPPQDQPNSNLVLNLQYLNLDKKDTITIRKLDATKTVLGDISASVSHVPQMMVPAEIGALVEIGRSPCEKETSDVVLVGHSSYLPACGSNLTLTPQANFQISSPLHPDTYPLYANCKWQLSAAKSNLLHLAFHSLKLAPNHCVKVIQNKTEQQFVGSDLPGDLFLTGEATVEFDSGNCTKAKGVSLVSSEGFVLNGTVSDCGGILSGKASGTFTVVANKTLCIWKVSVPETGHDASDVVNIISYTVSNVSSNEDKGNYELDVYDGDSIRDSKIVNDTAKTASWSRSSNLIFVYKRIDAAKPSTSVTVKYETISCNSTMQCDNKVCMHPDWRCDGVNDCGDYSDERNCNAVPIPPIVKLTGYSSSTFWATITVMLIIGVALGFGVPVCYQKYRNGQYRRFGEISIIE